jgi:hypothetical protein
MGIAVTGEITNLEEAADHLADDSYLQHLSLPLDGQLGGRTNEKGELFYTSELSRISIRWSVHLWGRKPASRQLLDSCPIAQQIVRRDELAHQRRRVLDRRDFAEC